jgi:8-hydroxy-5-deazaflavin:NADPH oxidoreductase
MNAEQVAIIGGTGDLGLGLAIRLAAAGVPIIIGSREAARAAQAADTVREKARQVATADVSVTGKINAEAAFSADIVIITVPFPAQGATLRDIKGSLREKTLVVDATVPLAATVGGKPTRLVGVWQGSAAEQAREIIPAANAVVAAFHNVSATALADWSQHLDCDVLVCGDDAWAKERLYPLIRLITGLRPVDAGPLESARIVESITALLIGMNRRYKVPHAGLRLTGMPAG